MTFGSFYPILSALLLAGFALRELDAAKFIFPESKVDVFVMPSANALFLWKYQLESADKEGIARTDCGYDESTPSGTKMKILISRLGNRPFKLNEEDFPSEFKGRVAIPEYKEGEIKLSIKDIVASDARGFRCSMMYWKDDVFNLQRPIYSATQNLKLVEPPKFTACLDKKVYELKENTEEQFQCTASGLPLPSITCLILDAEKKVLQSAGGGQGSISFSIKQPTRAMKSITCQASQKEGGKAASSAELKLQAKPRNVELVVAPIAPKKNEEVTLSCKADAYPKVTTWTFFKNDKELISSPDDKLPIKVTDCATKFSCQANNGVGTETSAAVVVNTNEAPKIIPPVKPMDFDLDAPFTLMCTVSGCPTPTVTWTKQSDPSFKAVGNKLSFPKLTIDHLGVYVCKATNSQGTHQASFTVSAYHKPVKGRFSSNASQGRIRKGTDLQLTCSSHGSPKAYYSIFHNGVLISETTTGKMTVKNVQCSKNGGNYTCIPKNRIGQGDKLSMWIYVEGKPEITQEPISKVVNTSSTVKFACKATGCPLPDVLWKKKGSNEIIHSGNVLEIKNVRQRDAVTYVCEAASRAGKATAEAKLKIANTVVNKRVGGNGGSVIKLSSSSICLSIIVCILQMRR